MKWVAKMLGLGVRMLLDTYSTTIYAIKHIRERPIDYLRDVLFGLTLAVILLNLVVSIILFAVQGGYAEQIAAIRGGGTSGGINAATRMGNRALELFRSGVLWGVGWALIAAQSLSLVVASFWHGNLAQRIMLAIDLIFAAILGLCAAVFQGLNRRIIPLSEAQETHLVELFQRSGQTMTTVFFTLCAVAGICFIIITLMKAEGRMALKYLVVSIVILYLVCPAILYLAGNIIPLIVSLILAAIIAVVSLFTVFAVISGGDSAGSGEGGSFKASAKPATSVKSSTTAKSAPKVIKLERGIQVHKVHGSMHDYVERRNSLDGSSEICSLNDLRNGKFVIYDANGRQLTENDIQWKPKK